MKKIALKTYGKIIASLFSLFGIIFGISSCEYDNGKAMYGCPSADYIIKGKVSSAADSTPIEKIKITFIEDSYTPDSLRAYTYTDENGAYEFSVENKLFDTLRIVATDVDSTANGGSFQSDTIEVEFTSADLIKKGDGNWYDGTYEKDNQDFSLKQK